MSSMKDIILHTPEQLGAAIRLKRKEKGLTQSGLAALLGAERKWVINLESGNSKAEIGLVLHALKALNLRASLKPAITIAITRRNNPRASRANAGVIKGGAFEMQERGP
jgi:transcriptional regulator with XRE-family HTH domain